jgi:ribosomally synthesized peptide (two-chain TOMM family)
MNIQDPAPFPQMRSAYLRSITKAWRDPVYQKVLAGAGNSPLCPRGALDLLEKEYRFTFPFNVKLVISDDPELRPRFEPAFTTGWLGVADDFKVYLPPPPSGSGEEGDPASVLARYCAEFPSLLGQATVEGLEAPEDFGNVGLYTARLVALIWHDEALRKAVYAAGDARALVQDTMDFIFPWNFQLRFAEGAVSGYAGSTTLDAYWEKFPRSEITLHLPMPPTDLDLKPVALASYNATGGQYPFSCT